MIVLFLLACSTGGEAKDTLVDPSEYTCEPFLQIDGATASGLEYCYADDYELGAIDRTSAEACAGDPRASVPACQHLDEGDCAKDADCAAGQVCGGAIEGPYCRCYDVCATDADCGTDETCLCAIQDLSIHDGGGAYSPGIIDQCLPSTCRTGADCPSGECGAAPNQCGQGGWVIGFSCRTPEDECHSNVDCPSERPVCTANTSTGRWECFESATCE